MHVAIYARVSTQRHREAIRLRSSRWLGHRRAEAQATDQQLDRLRAHAECQGWSVAADRVFRDDGYSGASLKRPGLDRLRDAAASGSCPRAWCRRLLKDQQPPQ